MTLSAKLIEDTLRQYGGDSVPGLPESICAYIELLLNWNRKISLTAVTDPVEIVKFHFGESLFVLPRLKTEKSRLADVGSGAGFPGLPLAMAVPRLEVTLIESNAKKCAFLAEVIRSLKVPNAHVHRGRMDSLPAEVPPFDFITARAVGQFDQLLPWARSHLAANGRLLLWLGDTDARKLLDYSSWSWGPPLLIPGSARRLILAGSSRP